MSMLYIFNRYTHSYIKYRGKYIDKVLVYRSHIVDSDPAKRRAVSLFTDRPFAMHPIVPIGKLSERAPRRISLSLSRLL